VPASDSWLDCSHDSADCSVCVSWLCRQSSCWTWVHINCRVRH